MKNLRTILAGMGFAGCLLSSTSQAQSTASLQIAMGNPSGAVARTRNSTAGISHGDLQRSGGLSLRRGTEQAPGEPHARQNSTEVFHGVELSGLRFHVCSKPTHAGQQRDR